MEPCGDENNGHVPRAPFRAGDFERELMRATCEAVKSEMYHRFAAIRHPETGEFPTVRVLGADHQRDRQEAGGTDCSATIVDDTISSVAEGHHLVEFVEIAFRSRVYGAVTDHEGISGMTKSDMDAIEVARELLTRLADTKESGFEGLLCELLSAHLRASLRLCSSGRQYGRDMGNGEIAAEAKRYGDTRLNVREIAGEIAIAKDVSPSLTLWILGTTQVLAEQDFKALDRVAAKHGVEFAVFDWSPASCPRLLTLIALHEAVAQIWFARHAPDAWKAVAEGIAMTRARGEIFSRTAKELEHVASGLGLAERLRETLVRAVATAVADPTGRLSRDLFGQRIDFGSPDACAIERSDIDRSLDGAYERNGKPGYSCIVVRGPEGVGKTWAVVAHALKRWPDRPVLFFSSLLIEESERGDWGHARLLAECIRRTVSVLDECDQRFREEKFVDRLLSALRSASAEVFDPIIVLDGFNERQGGYWASMISSLPALISMKRSTPLVVTTRPAPWAKLARDLIFKEVKVEQVEVGAFSEPEFEAACMALDIDAGAFDLETAKDLRNPRLFRIAAGLLPELAGAPVTRERVFLEYWRHRQEESRTNGLEPEEFNELLREHARGAWGNLKLLRGERTLYFDARATQEAARFVGVEAAVHDVQDAVTSGFFAPGARSDRDESRLVADRLNYVLGLSLQRRLLDVTDEAADDAENRACVSDRLGEDLEPMFDTDAAGVILATAMLATCLQKTRNPAVSVGCLVHLLGQRNARNDEVAPTVRGLVNVAACADPRTFVAAVEELDDRDTWLVEALRIALAASDDRRFIVEALHRWLGDDEGATVTTALHVLAGHDLAPYRAEIRKLHDPLGQPDLAFWLLLLDEASRRVPFIPKIEVKDEEEDVDDEEAPDEGADDEVGSIYEEISILLRGDLLREERRARARAAGLADGGPEENLPSWSDDNGHVPPLPPSLGRDWSEVTTHSVQAMARRRIVLQPEMHLFHVQLFENRLSTLDPIARAEHLRAIIAANSPPPAPPNYKLGHRWKIDPEILGQIVDEALDDPVSLIQTLGWFEYFDVTDCSLSSKAVSELTAIVVVDEVSGELRSAVGLFLGRVRNRDVARRLAESHWRPADERDTGVSLHASTALLPLCSEAGAYERLRDKIVATILCDVVEIVPPSDLAMVVDDFERHVENCLDDLRCNGYPTSRSVAGEYLCPEGSDRKLPLATLEMSEGTIRRLQAFEPTLPYRWFQKLFDLRTIFGGDESIIEFLAGLLIGIGKTEPRESARCIDQLLDHLALVMADADDAVFLSDYLISVVFQLPSVEPVRQAVGRLVRIANDDATLLQIVRAATGDWRSWLETFCREERAADRPGRVARARTLQAMAGFQAEALPETFSPDHIERHAGRIEDDRRTAEAAARDWVTAAPDTREALEIGFLEAAMGQVLDLPDLASCGEIGAFFEARIRAHEVQQIIERSGMLFGLPGPPTRFLASNDKSRVLRAGANRRRRFAEREA